MSGRRRSPPVSSPRVEPATDRLRPLWLGAFTALSVAAPMLPSETVLFGGSMLVVMLLWWALLLAWLLAGAARGRLEIRLEPAIWVGAAFLAWHSISALVMSWHGQPRASLNMLWLWVSFGIAFFLARQFIATAAERRAVCAVMIVLAVSLSVTGYYQYFYDLPLTRAQYLQDPEKVLQDAGVQAPLGSSQRRLFEDRLRSTEPLATFALTNSLAGFLSPWLIVVIGIALSTWNAVEVGPPSGVKSATRRWTRIAAVIAVLLILGCWVLTKSRSAWLATLGGIVLLAIYGRRGGWRPDWRIVTGLGAAAVVLPFLGVVVGGLDWLVVLESSKSFLYRVQYWRAAAEMIGDYPWFGCGPGNFQQYYTAYKLPEASETIADPHNFLLEIWATAGTPALALFLSFWGAIVWQVWQVGSPPTNGDSRAENEPPPSETEAFRAVYWGTLAGALLAFGACGFLEGYFPNLGLFLFGFPIGAGVLAMLHRWVIGGTLSSAVVGIAIVVMLVNLLAAGGIGFAGVAQSLWLLTALLLHQVTRTTESVVDGRRTWGRWPAIGLTVFASVFFVLFHQTAYSPVTLAAAMLNEGNTQRILGRPFEALTSFHKAAALDPYSPEPWDQVAELTHEGWRQSGDLSLATQFERATRECLARNSHSSQAHSLAGHRWLLAYRQFGSRDLLEQAIRCYGIAVALYPNYNLGHAQLAWAWQLAGDPSAVVEADEALRLDSLNPHQEQKLARQRLFDAIPTDTAQPAAPGDRSAEQVLLEIRKHSISRSE